MSKKNHQHQRFHNIGFEDFRNLAKDDSLSENEKIGFPDSYREGYGQVIFVDIEQKLSRLQESEQIVLDIGSGCGELARRMIELCREKKHHLILVDSQEMLDFLPDEDFITKIPAYYPDETTQFLEDYAEKINVILVYSVIQYVFAEGNIYDFLDKSLSLLANRGQCLIGDIPNISKRKRFFASKTGIAFHKDFMKTDDEPEIDHLVLESQNLDDAVLFGLLLRARSAGFDSYLLPQMPALPMANRREDILIERP